MSPRRVRSEPSERVVAELRRFGITFGQAIRDARLARHWTVRELATRAGISAAMVYRIEGGAMASAATSAALAMALGRRLEIHLIDPRRPQARQDLGADPVHSAMGELEARHFRAVGFPVGIDEPHQHYQFAGRADLVAWDLDRRALLHIENRTRFPDLQETAGSYNAKRAYLGAALGERLGVRRWASETHVLAGLWSSEVMHVLRIRTETLRSLCPEGPDCVSAWWSGRPPATGTHSTFVLLDLLARPRQRLFIGLEEGLTARPRTAGYAEVARLLNEAASIGPG